ncbi:ABC transporter ATP-binding protein [Nereida sp. NH-UV-3]|uniref:ABC transporter ATP-binding protein n=1 Tax=Nereida TaxID=282198 RepID=UPI0036F2195E
MSLLELSNVSAFYGASQALFDVSLTLEEGQVLAMMGRNGMGKSTTVKVVCRLLQHKDGQVIFDGQNVKSAPSHKVAQLGVGLVPEGRRCFSNLTVYENLVVAARSGEWNFASVSKLFPRLSERKDQKASSLSGGEQQMLAIGRALMTNPKLLILDEATEGLAPVVRQEIWRAIERLKSDSSMSILVIDKSLKELSRIADTAVILEKGRSVWSGDFTQLTPDVTDPFLGV